jgi:hypothetical protein
MAKPVTVVTTAETVRIWIDGDEMRLDDGACTIVVPPGAHHAISWAARGAPGTSYSIRITTPTEARLEVGDTFDAGAFDVGVAWFRVNA